MFGSKERATMSIQQSSVASVQEQPRIDSCFAAGRTALSFEFFPPRNEEGHATLFASIEDLTPLRPDFISITRTGVGTDPTIDLTAQVQNELGFRSMAHLTCAHHNRDEMRDALDRLWQSGVRNVLALRGDASENQRPSGENAFNYADDLVAFAREQHDWCVAVAGYPEGHPQCLNPTRDIEMLKQKVDAGAHVIITQLFFDNTDFFRWRDNCRAMGIEVPIVAGIMPILNVAQIKRFVTMCGAKIPQPLLVRLESLESDPMSVHSAGVEHAISQCEELIAEGVDGLHFYTLNKSKATNLITQALQGKR
jgi:methylenetetrahydrofolate reductase (NADPH)